MRKRHLILILFAGLMGCASSTNEGVVGVRRRQFLVFPEQQMNFMAAEAYDGEKVKAKKKNALDQNPAQLARVQEVAKRLIPHTAVFRKDAKGWAWEVHIISSPELNAYCMPGGKIIFYTGIIEKLKLTDGEMATIMGHEIAHALREHGRERMSEELAKQGLLEVAVMTGKLDPKHSQLVGLAFLTAMTLPHSRRDETEADEIGLEVMARAGYDPREAVSLWKKMREQGGPKPPALLSTHPADDQRIATIENLLPKVLPLYQQSLPKN